MARLSSLAPRPRHLATSLREPSYAHVLRVEFGSPFVIIDAVRLNVITAPTDFPAEINDTATLPLVRRVRTTREVQLSSEPADWRLLGLPVWKGDDVSRVAVGLFRRVTDSEADTGISPAADAEFVTPYAWGTAEHLVRSGGPIRQAPAYPIHVLERWAQAVADRQRLTDWSHGKSHECARLEEQLAASSKLLPVIDRLAGRLRLSDRPEKFQKHALTSLFETLPLECLAWVPAVPHDAVSVVGPTAIAADQIRRLVTEALAQGDEKGRRIIVENNVAVRPWAFGYPTLRCIAIVSADDEKPTGWLIAINKGGSGEFGDHDLDLMRPVASLLNVFRKNLNVYVDLKELLFGVVRSLTSAIDAKDPYTRGHSERVARAAVCIGRQLELGTDELSNLYLAGLLHDVGKIGIKDQVLQKADRLTPSEYRHVMSHVEIGVSILRELKRLRHVLPGILHHHERYEGGGYPDGIQGEGIPLIARILAVADSFDAMTSDRPYRSRRSSSEVESILRGGAAKQWDPKVIEAALACWSELCAIQHRGLGESLRVAVDDALHHDYAGTDGSNSPQPSK